MVVLLQPIQVRQIRLRLISTNHRHQAAFCLDQIHFQIIHLLILEFQPRTIHNLIQCLLTSLIRLHISTANKVKIRAPYFTPHPIGFIIIFTSETAMGSSNNDGVGLQAY